jgi:peptidyl-dipeptidase A
MKRHRSVFAIAIFSLLLLEACASAPMQPAAPEPMTGPALEQEPAPASSASAAAPSAPTADDARRFVEMAEAELLELQVASNHASWIQSNFITHDSQVLAAKASEDLINAGVRYAKEASRFDGVSVAADVRRKLDLLKTGLTAPAPSDPAKTKELTTILSRMEATYGEGKYCKGSDCLDIGEITKIMAESRDPKRLLDVWQGWRTISRPMRADYQRFVELTNEGARELGYKDTGALWRSKYDMPPDEFRAELDRLWGQVKPLYESLHCYVRWKLNDKYGDAVVPESGPIPAHLLGNIWAQDWSNIYDLVAPKSADPGYDLTKRLEAKGYTPLEMVKTGERFFTSLGFEPLPQTFWERSLFVKPRDREVVCHASAWDIDEVDDLRIKMCIEVNAEDFRTIHHELGHNFYQRAYNKLPFLFRNSANDGFHEAIGDTIALSVTPSYLRQIGLISKEPDASKDIGLLLKDALEGVAFLPFGLLVDQWRWKVFNGEIAPSGYNAGWWELRERYQGVKAPVARSENDFDPGAKYHIPGNTPYTRYFLARILQYQFHRSLCQAAGYEGALNRCSIYGNKAAGQKLRDTLAVGVSRPWPEALQLLTGQQEMDATALVDYYAPLRTWLDQQNRGKTCGW